MVNTTSKTHWQLRPSAWNSECPFQISGLESKSSMGFSGGFSLNMWRRNLSSSTIMPITPPKYRPPSKEHGRGGLTDQQSHDPSRMSTPGPATSTRNSDYHSLMQK